MLTADQRPAWRGYTAHQLQRCAERELGWRRKVYPNRVLTGRLSQTKAAMEIDMMRAIAEDYAALAAKEKLL
jgi:hypothetical protein